MQLAKLVTVTLLGAFFGAVSGVVAGGSIVTAHASGTGKACSNTFCLPEEETCFEEDNWTCTLSGGCSGVERCN
jgi:hypothetical protein